MQPQTSRQTGTWIERWIEPMERRTTDKDNTHAHAHSHSLNSSLTCAHSLNNSLTCAHSLNSSLTCAHSLNNSLTYAHSLTAPCFLRPPPPALLPLAATKQCWPSGRSGFGPARSTTVTAAPPPLRIAAAPTQATHPQSARTRNPHKPRQRLRKYQHQQRQQQQQQQHQRRGQR